MINSYKSQSAGEVRVGTDGEDFEYGEYVGDPSPLLDSLPSM